MKTEITIEHENGKTYSYTSEIVPTIGSWIETWEREGGSYSSSRKIIQGRVYDLTYIHLKHNYDWNKDEYLNEGTAVIVFIKEDSKK